MSSVSVSNVYDGPVTLQLDVRHLPARMIRGRQRRHRQPMIGADARLSGDAAAGARE